MTDSKPYLIIGQGIAGTILSYRLWQAQIPFKVLDDPSLSRSSRIAAGLANPVVLKRQKWVSDAETYLPVCAPFYQELEAFLKVKLYHPTPLEHIFHSVGELNDWHQNSTKTYLKNHLSVIDKTPLAQVISPHGRGRLNGVFWVETDAMISAWRAFLDQEGFLVGTNPESDNFTTIHCNGHLFHDYPRLAAKTFTRTKGEVMIIESDELPEDRILHAGVFTMPLGNKRFKVGATYAHHHLNDEPSAQGLAQLREKLEVFFTGSYRVVEHLAGVRPNIKDRKPIMGQIAANEYVFNGLGSRGILMAPYLSALMVDYLENKANLPSHWDIKRFISA